MVLLRILSKDTILKAIHNIVKVVLKFHQLRILSKDTILKAIHNTHLVLAFLPLIANSQ